MFKCFTPNKGSVCFSINLAEILIHPGNSDSSHCPFLSKMHSECHYTVKMSLPAEKSE